MSSFKRGGGRGGSSYADPTLPELQMPNTIAVGNF